MSDLFEEIVASFGSTHVWADTFELARQELKKEFPEGGFAPAAIGRRAYDKLTDSEKTAARDELFYTWHEAMEAEDEEKARWELIRRDSFLRPADVRELQIDGMVVTEVDATDAKRVMVQQETLRRAVAEIERLQAIVGQQARGGAQ